MVLCSVQLFACIIWFEVQKKLLFYNSNTFILISSDNQDSAIYARQGKTRNGILVFTFSLNFILCIWQIRVKVTVKLNVYWEYRGGSANELNKYIVAQINDDDLKIIFKTCLLEKTLSIK